MFSHRFHPSVERWFASSFPTATAPQLRAWPHIQAGRNVLVAAPTGSGKTLAAFLASIDDLVGQALAGTLADETQVVYVSPLYVLLGSASGRGMLSTTRTVIVDEIHAIAGNKRGSHLALSLARLDALVEKPPVRIGLSATQKPIDEIAQFLVGTKGTCKIVDVGHVRERDLAIELPASPLEAVMSHDVWAELYQRIADLAASHRTTLVFVNTRRMAERAARHLTELLGSDQVMSH